MSKINPDNKCSQLLSCSLAEFRKKVRKEESTTLQELFEMQKSLQLRVNQPVAIPIVPDAEYQTEYFKITAGNIMESWSLLTLEYAELLERLPFKHWKRYPDMMKMSDEDILELQFEFIDMFHFFMNIGIALGLTGDEVAALYKLKNNENHDRQNRGY